MRNIHFPGGGRSLTPPAADVQIAAQAGRAAHPAAVHQREPRTGRPQRVDCRLLLSAHSAHCGSADIVRRVLRSCPVCRAVMDAPAVRPCTRDSPHHDGPDPCWRCKNSRVT